jgi:hypothetical protein
MVTVKLVIPFPGSEVLMKWTEKELAVTFVVSSDEKTKHEKMMNRKHRRS